MKKTYQRQRKIKLSYNEKKELENIEQILPSLEQQLHDIDDHMNNVTEYQLLSELTKQRDDLTLHIQNLEERLLELMEKQENED